SAVSTTPVRRLLLLTFRHAPYGFGSFLLTIQLYLIHPFEVQCPTDEQDVNFGVEIQMSSVLRSSIVAMAAAIALAACSGSTPRRDRAAIDPRDRLLPHLHPTLSDTIGQYAIFADSAPLLVEGYGVVAQLPGTGSGDMPPSIRNLLTEQLYRQ